MCDCQDNQPSFFDSRTVTARKSHQCDECLDIIEIGERHEYTKGVWDGEFSTFRTCLKCIEMTKEINLQCWCMGSLIDAVNWDYEGVSAVAAFLERRARNMSNCNITQTV